MTFINFPFFVRYLFFVTKLLVLKSDYVELDFSNANCSLSAYNDQEFCTGFKSWSELNNLSNITLYLASVHLGVRSINIRPVTPLRLNSELQMYQLVSFPSPLVKFFRFNFMRISGLDVWPWSNELNASKSLAGLPARIAFEQSYIEFYKNGTPLSHFNCNESLIPHENFTLFNAFSSVLFQRRNKYSSDPVCPFIFANANLLIFLLDSQIDTLILRNLFQFQALTTNVSKIQLNSTIVALMISGYGFTLDASLIHPLIFEKAEMVNIVFTVGSIEDGVFKNFNNLQFLCCSMRTSSMQCELLFEQELWTLRSDRQSTCSRRIQRILVYSSWRVCTCTYVCMCGT
jgi:hypothetical protein